MTGIYYADLFDINGKGCLIMGHGKTDTCQNYAGDDTILIGSDSARLAVRNGELVGFYDPSLGTVTFDEQRVGRTYIQFIIYMMGDEEKYSEEVVEVNKAQFCEIAYKSIVFAAPNPEARIEEFIKLIGDIDVRCLVVPWCEEIKSKGKLLKDYIG